MRGGPNRHNIHSLRARILRRISTLEQLIQCRDVRANPIYIYEAHLLFVYPGHHEWLAK